MGNVYNFDEFKNLYDKERKEKDSTSDIFDQEFGELDEIEIKEDNNTTLTFTEEAPKFHLEPEILEITPTKQVNEEPEDEMDKTKEIDNMSLAEIKEIRGQLAQAGVINPIEDIYNGKTNDKPKVKALTKNTDMEAAFVNCAILGFITAAIGSGMLLYILNHI